MDDSRREAFTLVELLAVMAILVVLAGLTFSAVTGSITQGRKAMEISSARKLVAAYLSYAAENNGDLMPGYQTANATDATGQSIEFPANARYPWRLAPYLDYDMHTILFNGNENALHDQVDFHYAASLAPNLGMNVTFVGGDYGSSSDLVPGPRATAMFGDFCVTNLSQVSRPSSLMVFASARESTTQVGFYQIKSPVLTGVRWSGKWDPKASAEAYGFLDLRYQNHVVAAMLDGHVALLDQDEVQDMRHWSNQAAEQNNPSFKLHRN